MNEDEIQKIKYREPTSDYTRGFNSGVDTVIASGQFISVKEVQKIVEQIESLPSLEIEASGYKAKVISRRDVITYLIQLNRNCSKSQEKIET